jgi:hypothetical protein
VRPSHLAHTCVGHVDRALGCGAIERGVIVQTTQIAVVVKQAQLVAHLAHAEVECLFRRDRTVSGELQLQVIQIRLAVAVGPPEARVRKVQLGKLRGRERDRGVARGKRNCLLHNYALERGAELALHRLGELVVERHADVDVGLGDVGQGQMGDDLGVAERDRTGG